MVIQIGIDVLTAIAILCTPAKKQADCHKAYLECYRSEYVKNNNNVSLALETCMLKGL